MGALGTIQLVRNRSDVVQSALRKVESRVRTCQSSRGNALGTSAIPAKWAHPVQWCEGLASERRCHLESEFLQGIGNSLELKQLDALSLDAVGKGLASSLLKPGFWLRLSVCSCGSANNSCPTEGQSSWLQLKSSSVTFNVLVFLLLLAIQ